ncbi:unnamed protein product [Agarophyton chilense]|eukprot:gb/GEZJ01002933.1/.p2 GENE.gb/GEZJ01002933.1/~~gb/GEZJ01002933.1/.p2  ORF type:complete len:492 (-),score=91.58 gb/GEZJ01002933.1/:2204-3460(-)
MGRRQRTPSPQSAPPPLEELDIAAFSELLRPTGLLIRDVANDGNCFFRAVSDQLYGYEDEHMKLRELACDYLEQNADHYKHFIDEEQSFDEYVSEMRNDGVWADNLELQAISMACSVNIRVHQSGKPSYDIRNHPAKQAVSIHLSYHFGEHYASVRPLHTADSQVPAQHDPLPLPRPPTNPESENEPPQEESSSNRRLRFRKHSDQDSVSSMWKRTERAHYDACAAVEKARRAARSMRAAESSSRSSSDAKYETHNIERDMKAARKKLESHFETIDNARSSYRKRAHKLQKENRRRRFTSGSTSSQSDGSSTQPDESSDNEQRYRESVRRQTDLIHEELINIEKDARTALNVITQLEKQLAKKSQGKHAKSSKKREQEAKKKDRKARRRRAQEKFARNEPENIRPPNILQPHELDIAI